MRRRDPKIATRLDIAVMLSLFCVMLAVYHDVPEILTGDMPTPVKYYNPAIREAYRQVEQ